MLGGALAGVLLLAPTARATVFSNPATITLPDPNCTDPDVATPYPSNISVAGLSGTVTDVNVTLNGVTHPFEGDIDILLVSPAGGVHNLQLLSDAGTGSLSNATVTFDDSAAAQAPQNSAWGPSTYKPTNYTELSGADTFPAPAPAPSGNTTLAAAFNGIAPNGTWSLYVIDDACPDAGSIGGGWSLDITTASAAVSTTAVTSSLNPSRTGQSVTFTATVTSGGSPVTTGTVTFTEGATTLAANVAVDGAGRAVFSTSTLPEGNHIITATYNASPSFATSSGTVLQRVDNNTTVTGNNYCNTGAVTINDNGPATPYPSNVFVAGATTSLGKVTVTLKNVTHAFDGDVEALLVGPGGQNLVIVSDAGTAGVTNVTVTFDDAAAGLLPQAGSWAAPNSTISAKPTNYSELVSDTFSPPAPAPSVATAMSTFNGTNPNGTWSLYVKDDAAPDSGSIAGGWCLNLTTSVTPTLITDASPGGTVGTQLNDVATLSGGNNPTGTITFDLYGPDDATCAGPVVFTSARAVSGNGNYTSDTFTPASAGTYRWRARYSGDANNNAVAPTACNDPDESAVVTAPVATISTQATPAVTLGSPISDTATVTGAAAPAPAPTGTVVFTLFGPNNATCTGAPIFTSAAQPLAGGPPPTATSGPFTPTAVGTYRWVAAYSGNANHAAVTSPCNAPNESSTVTKASPSISTQASAGGPVGTAVTDTATVSGGAGPTGTVTFRLFSNAACTTQVFTSTNALGGGGTATSGNFPPAAPGTYFWTAVYNGDAKNNAATSGCNAPNESVIITKASPSISTQASPGNLLGAPVRDVATLGGGLSPTGTVTFRLFSNNTCTTQVFTSTNPLAGLTATSGWFTPAAPGTYFWTAVYNGDVNNNAATSACQTPNESVTLAAFQSPAITRTITGDLVGPVTVNSGDSVLITAARVVGPVTVNPGGALTVVNSKIARGISANAPRYLSICGAEVSPPSSGVALSVGNAAVPIRIGDPAAGCAGNRFAGQVNLTSNLAVTFGANVVSQNTTIDNNGPGNTVIKANNVFGTLGCAGNNPPPSNAGQVNTAGAKTGQCAGL